MAGISRVSCEKPLPIEDMFQVKTITPAAAPSARRRRIDGDGSAAILDPASAAEASLTGGLRCCPSTR